MKGNEPIMNPFFSSFRSFSIIFISLLLFQPFPCVFSVDGGADSTKVEDFFQQSRHTNNWAVLVCTSRFWFNYRHVANALGVYRTVKRLGIPDSQIILMLADDMACNPRNIYPGKIYNNENHKINLYGDNIEVDYRGYDVTVKNFLQLLTGRHPEDVPRSKRLLTDERSNILIYMTGHGGEEFLKFQDAEEITSSDLGDAFEQMHEQRRYHEILFIVDTCQANTLYTKFYSPNVLAIGSSQKGENSYSHHSDYNLGLAMIDRFTYWTLEYFEKVGPESKLTLKDLFDTYSYGKLHSNAGIRHDLFNRPIDKVLLTDFFGSVTSTYLTQSHYPMIGNDTVKLKSKTTTPTEKVSIHSHTSTSEEKSGLPTILFHTNFLIHLFGFCVLVGIISLIK